MLDCRGKQVNIGDTVWIGQRKGVLDEAVFIGETKKTFMVKCNGAHKAYSLPKFLKTFNRAVYAEKDWTKRQLLPVYIYEDISQKPCRRIIKID